MTSYDEEDLNSYRGNVYMQKQLDPDGIPVEKDSLGRIVYEPVKDEDLVNRRNYKKADVINYLDGDEISEVTYDYAKTTLISDKARVFKGGSWADMPFWLSPGARRFLDQDLSAATLGFRCAMDRVGSPAGNETPGGNQFKKK
jgi:hypothetical protein